MRTLVKNFRWWTDSSPRQMLVEDGRVLIAPTTEAIHLETDNTEDLNGHFLLPSFYDAHCHILPTGLDLLKLNLSSCQTKPEVLDAVRDWHRANPEGWLLAVQYDQTKYANGQHIHRSELDAISAIRPILLRHYNGHCSVANSAALASAGVGRETPNPGGGEYVRDAQGELTGVLLEDAHDFVWSCTPKPTLEQMVEAILAAGDKMHALGITSAADMMTGRFDLEQEFLAYQLAASRGCKIRTRLYLQWREVFGPKGIGLSRLHELEPTFTNPDGTRIAGIKLFADGAIGSATAAIYGNYSGQTAKGMVISRNGRATEQTGTSGQLIYAPDKLTEMTKIASDAGYQVAIHAIGDYAADLVMDAFEATGDASRHRLEHAMIMSDSQLDRLAKLGSYLTFQPEFLMRFGHAYRLQLGEERTSLLKRSRSVIDRGIRLSYNSDRPIVPGDPRDGIRTAVTRPPGFATEESVTVNEAIHAYTQAGADVCGDGDLVGSLSMGQVAEYQSKLNLEF
jgi:predicted amidohydrolase YtcJ